MPEEIENYPSNSKERKQPVESEKKVEAVSTNARTRKKPISSRVKDTFASEDVRSVGGYIMMDVVVPAIKSMLLESVNQGLERMFYGDSRPRSKQVGSNTRYTSYDRMHKNSNRSMTARGRAIHDFDEVVVDTRGEAEETLDVLGHLINEYEVATVADFYDAVGISKDFTDAKWGWTSLSGARVRRVRDGYLISLPKPIPLD